MITTLSNTITENKILSFTCPNYSFDYHQNNDPSTLVGNQSCINLILTARNICMFSLGAYLKKKFVSVCINSVYKLNQNE